jgi:hypothetical protein
VGDGPDLDELDDDRDNEGVDRDRLGQTGADDHRRADVARCFRVAPECLHGLADSNADAEAWANGAKADRQRGANSARGVNSIGPSHSTEHPASSSRQERLTSPRLCQSSGRPTRDTRRPLSPLGRYGPQDASSGHPRWLVARTRRRGSCDIASVDDIMPASRGVIVIMIAMAGSRK